MPESFEEFPQTFASHSRPSARVYRMRHDCFAAPSNSPGLDECPLLAELPDEGISVFGRLHATLSNAATSESIPVYAFSDSEPPAVPTGRVFVTGSQGVKLEALVKPLGYEIQSRPGYAPNSAWLVAVDRSIATALANLKNLMNATGLDSVEPQMLRPSQPRGPA